MNRKAVYLIFGSLCLLGLAAYHLMPRVIIHNLSGQDISQLTLEISGKTLDYGEILSGKLAKKSLRIDRDSRFTVTYQWQNGQSARLQVGHIKSPAWWSRTHITVEAGGDLEIRYDKAGF